MTVRKNIKDSETLVVAFTGFAGKLHLPVEEFFKEAGLDHASKLIIHDPSYLKTLNGLAPFAANFAEMVQAIKLAISRVPHKHLIFLGTSGGGHSALLYAHLLQAHRSIVFSCYPYLSIAQGKKMNDPALETMKRLSLQFDALPANVKQYFDLREVLETWNGVTQYDVHAAKNNEWDNKRAHYLEGLPHLRLHEHPYSDHALASALAKDGKLEQCFK